LIKSDCQLMKFAVAPGDARACGKISVGEAFRGGDEPTQTAKDEKFAAEPCRPEGQESCNAQRREIAAERRVGEGMRLGDWDSNGNACRAFLV
jgi:hypothetical protein